MNITQEKIDELNSVVKLIVTEEDYKEGVAKVLKDYKKNVSMKGFRQGKVPMRVIERLYGAKAKAEEVDKMVSQELSKFLIDSKVDVLGQPLPSKDQKQIDLDKSDDLEFLFDIAIAPQFDLNIDENIEIPYYNIKVEDEDVENQIKNYQQRHGKSEEEETVAENSYIKGLIEQIDQEGNPTEDGVKSDATFLSIELIKDEEIKKSFIGANINQIISFDVKKAYPNDTEIAGMLKIDKEQVPELDPNFQITIEQITGFTKAEVNEELFDKVFGEGNVKTEEEFKEKIIEEIKKIYSYDTEYKFSVDAKKELIKITNLSLPNEFLKRWLIISDKEGKMTDEILEKDYPLIADDLRWQLISGSIAKKQEFKIEEEQLLEQAKELTVAQFQQYGMQAGSIPEESLNGLAKLQLERPEDREKIVTQVLSKMTFSFIKENCKHLTKEVTKEELKELFEQDNKTE